MNIQQALKRSACVCALCICGVAGSAEYTVIDLGSLGGTSLDALGLNDSGWVAGRADLPTGVAAHAILWDGSLIDLGALGDQPQSAAFAVNNLGDVVGQSYDFGNIQSKALLWSGGSMIELGDFVARDINESGIVVGNTMIATAGLTAVPRAVRYDGAVTILGTLGGDQSEAIAVNDLGWVVGGSGLSTAGVTHAFVHISGVMHDLGTLGGNYSFAYDISGARQVVGASRTAAGIMHAFVFQLDEVGNVITKTDLGELGGSYSAAHGINENGQIVGTSDGKAFLWNSGVMSDLNAMIPANSEWRLHRAMAINESGQIVGTGWHQGLPRGFLLTPTTTCEGDANGDGMVDPLDSGYIMARFGCPVNSGDADCDAADVNADGLVDPLDAGFVLARFGTCP